MMPYKVPLSGAPDTLGSSINGIGGIGTETTIHTIPPNETHTIWLVVTNSNNSATIELVGIVGASANGLDWTQAAETTRNLAPITLHGGSAGTTLKLGAVANGSHIKVCGTVERYLSVR